MSLEKLNLFFLFVFTDVEAGVRGILPALVALHVLSYHSVLVQRGV